MELCEAGAPQLEQYVNQSESLCLSSAPHIPLVPHTPMEELLSLWTMGPSASCSQEHPLLSPAHCFLGQCCVLVRVGSRGLGGSDKFCMSKALVLKTVTQGNHQAERSLESGSSH